MMSDKTTFVTQWPKIRPHVVRLLRQQDISQPDWQNLFWDIHAVYIWDDKGAEQLDRALQEDVATYVREAQRRVMDNQEDTALLTAYIREWRKFFAQCRYLPLPFRPCDVMSKQRMASNNWCQKKTSSESPLAESPFAEADAHVRRMMLVSWNDYVFQKIRNRLQDSAMKLIQAERKGESFESQLVIGVRESCVHLIADSSDNLEVYVRHFEKPYINATGDYYKVEAARQVEKNGVHDYMRFADAKLREEEARGAKYLESNSNSLALLKECLVEHLVEHYMDQMLAECSTLIKSNDTEKLALLFRLMDQVADGRGITPMLEQMNEYIVQQGLADMRANAGTITQDCEKYVEALLDLYNKFSKLVEEATDNDPRFLSARDKGFEEIVNNCSIFMIEIPNKPKSTKTTPESRCPELLANYSDMLLRKTPLSRKLTSDQIDAKLNEVLILLRYVKNKDIFMRYHKHHLTRRLILEISADSEKEENLVESLRNVGMPADYINNMQRMFKDIELSKGLNKEFKEFKERQGGAQQGRSSFADAVNIKILNVGSWARSADVIPVSLPIELEDLIPEVEEFHRQKYNGRKLQWHHHMANGTVTFSNSMGKFDLEVTTLQMAVLFAWNQRPLDKISFEGLRLATELPDSELRRTLYSLVNSTKIKKQVLLCDVPDIKTPKDFKECSVFWVNQEFCIVKNNKTQKRGRLNLIGRLQLASEKTPEENHNEIAVLRELRTEEGIMKLMKMRKRISYAQLQTELVEILKGQFSPSRKLIKECIEKLINNNHVSRSELDLNEYVYVA